MLAFRSINDLKDADTKGELSLPSKAEQFWHSLIHLILQYRLSPCSTSSLGLWYTGILRECPWPDRELFPHGHAIATKSARVPQRSDMTSSLPDLLLLYPRIDHKLAPLGVPGSPGHQYSLTQPVPICNKVQALWQIDPYRVFALACRGNRSAFSLQMNASWARLYRQVLVQKKSISWGEVYRSCISVRQWLFGSRQMHFILLTKLTARHKCDRGNHLCRRRSIAVQRGLGPLLLKNSHLSKFCRCWGSILPRAILLTFHKGSPFLLRAWSCRRGFIPLLQVKYRNWRHLLRLPIIKVSVKGRPWMKYRQVWRQLNQTRRKQVRHVKISDFGLSWNNCKDALAFRYWNIVILAFTWSHCSYRKSWCFWSASKALCSAYKISVGLVHINLASSFSPFLAICQASHAPCSSALRFLILLPFWAITCW